MRDHTDYKTPITIRASLNRGDDEPYELDVIGLCCDIQGITADDVIDDLDADDEGLVPEEAIIEALTDAANNEGYLLWVGKDEGELVAYYI